MRKYLLITLCLFTVAASQAQSRAGIRLAPNLSFNRIDSSSDTLSLSPSGAAGRLTLGPVLDFSLGTTDNYFTTGLLFSSQRVALEAVNTESNHRLRELYSLQYLQFPTTFTFVSDEIGLDKRIYLEMGGVFAVKVKEKDLDPNQFLIRKFNTFNLSAVIGAGMEFAMGTSTNISVGLAYYRGLGNVVSSHTPMDAPLSIKNDQLSLDLTVRF